MIEASRQLPAAERFDVLGKYVRIGSGVYVVPQMDVAQLEVFQRAQSLILQTPGHAEHFQKRIKDAQRAFEKVKGNTDSMAFGDLQQDLLNEQMYGFEKLGAMPSPETVRVLGEFLFDPWGLNPNATPGEDYSVSDGETAHAGRALKALASLPLETRANATPADRTQYWRDIDAWKLWYEQVKAGSRTFRFVGDPQNYSLAGPVAEAKEPQRREAKAPAVDAGKEAADESKPKGIPTTALILALAALAAALGLAFRRKAAAGS
jgi:hypothetical protein